MPNRRVFRPNLPEKKVQAFHRPRPNESQQPQSPPPKKPTPPEQTHAENFYWLKQMEAHTPVTIALTNGEELHGIIEWYDRDCIKLTRTGSPNLLIFKRVIKFLYKESEEAAEGGRKRPGRA